MVQKLNIILSCTSRKRSSAGDGVRLRDFKGTLEQRSREWCAHLDAAAPASTVHDLYVGPYWRTAMELVATAAGCMDVAVWVSSAGLGLVALEDKVPAYSATFASGDVDSVARSSDVTAERRNWWHHLTSWGGPWRGHARSLTALAGDEPEGTVLVCVGPTYVDAMATDLIGARDRLISPDRLVVVTSRAKPAELRDNVAAVSGRMRMTLGGAMGSVAPRAAQYAIERQARRAPLTVRSVRDTLSALDAESNALPRFRRSHRSDDEVRGWISAHLRANPAATKSRALRAYRDAGLACEQRRFGGLFAEVTTS